MHAVVFVPGIMGTQLLLKSAGEIEIVWPPTPLETQFGYKRTRKLASPDLQVGEIIRNVLCFDFYGPLIDMLEDLGATRTGSRMRRYDFPYDWRRDLFSLAKDLGTVVAKAVAQGATQVTIVAHSMGGLIARLLVEDTKYRSEPWFGAINQMITIATPHLGAPLALARVLGQDSALGISGADFAWLANQEDYPSAYQLLPAPGEAACWNQSDPALEPLDIYKPADAALLKLNSVLMARAKAVHDVLGANDPPPHVKYFHFGATGHRTVTRINIFKKTGGGIDIGRTVLTATEDGGDGTVPLFSALPRPGRRQIVTNEHATAFKGEAFRHVFVRLLGGNEGPATESVGGMNVDRMNLVISVESALVTTQQSIELLIFPDLPEGAGPAIGALSGDLTLVMVRDGEAEVDREIRRIPLTYSGPTLSRLKLYLDPIEKPGHYEVRLVSGALHARAAFSVCQALPTLNQDIAAEAIDPS